MTKFNDIEIGKTFMKNNTLWLKKSSRTAYVIHGDGYPKETIWFYFGLNETVYTI